MAQYVELNIDQGTDFNADLNITNPDGSSINVTNYTFTSSIRKSFYSSRPTASFTVNQTDPANGAITLSLTSGATANIRAGRYVFDVKQVDNTNKTTRLFEGIVTIDPQVTK